MTSTDPTPGPRPGPHLMPGAAPSAPADLSAQVDPELGATVRVRIDELMSEVDEIGGQVGDEFDLVALARQTQLLEQAHEVLTSALAEVDRR